VMFVTHSTLGYPRAVLSLEQGLALLLYNRMYSKLYSRSTTS